MLFKLETKEKFHVITPVASVLSASLTAEMKPEILKMLNTPVKNTVLSLKNVATLDLEAAAILASMQEVFYANEASFVVCEMADAVEELLSESEFYEVLNVVPTESEAWDMVQMEEIERELMSGDSD